MITHEIAFLLGGILIGAHLVFVYLCVKELRRK